MSALLRALSRRIRLAIHRHDPIECWCELTATDLPVQGAATLCPTCWVSPGMTHELSCPEVSPEQASAFLARDAR